MEEVEKNRNRQYYVLVSALIGCDYTNDNKLYIFSKNTSFQFQCKVAIEKLVWTTVQHLSLVTDGKHYIPFSRITSFLAALHSFWRHYMFFTQNARKMLSFQVFEKTVLHAALHEMQCRKTTVPAIRVGLYDHLGYFFVCGLWAIRAT